MLAPSGHSAESRNKTDAVLGGNMSWFSKRQDDGAVMRVSAPLARESDLVIEEMGDELLIYDQQNARAHCLSGVAARVWRACDGTRVTKTLSDYLELDHDVVLNALAQIEAIGLLDQGPVLAGTTRREFAGKAAKIGVASAMAPMVYSVLAPTPASAATPSVAQCQYYSAQSCDGCTQICGCCCCCQGCSTATTVSACKICLPTTLCSASNFGTGCSSVAGVVAGSCSSGPNCSATAYSDKPCSPGQTAGGKNSACDCYPPCTSAHEPWLTTCGNGSQPCNCTNQPNPC